MKRTQLKSSRPLIHFKTILNGMKLTEQQLRIVWRKAINYEQLMGVCTEADILAMCQPDWTPAQLTKLKPIADKYLTRFPFLKETTLVSTQKIQLLAAMPSRLVVFEAKLELSVICDDLIPKIRQLFESNPEIFDPKIDYNIHEIAVKYFPIQVTTPATNIAPVKTAQQFFLQELWEREPESFRKSINNTLYYWKIRQDTLWAKIPADKKEKYIRLENADKLRRRMELFKYMKSLKH